MNAADPDAGIGGQPIQGQGYAIGVDRVKELTGPLRDGHSQGWGGFGLEFSAGSRRARRKGVIAVPMEGGARRAQRPVAGLASRRSTAQRSARRSPATATRSGSIGSGQTAVLTVQTKPNVAPKQLQVKFR